MLHTRYEKTYCWNVVFPFESLCVVSSTEVTLFLIHTSCRTMLFPACVLSSKPTIGISQSNPRLMAMLFELGLTKVHILSHTKINL